MLKRPIHYGAVVAGAGPAGLAVVGNLIENKIDGKVLWVDPHFQGGKLGRAWREVPSNTKAGLFVDYAKALEPFRRVLQRSDDQNNAVAALEKLDQDKGCPIAYAGDMCQMLTDGVAKLEETVAWEGRVTGANWDSRSSSWTVEIGDSTAITTSTVSSSRLLLCIGSTPRGIPVSVPDLVLNKVSLDVALAPSKLSTTLEQDATIGVVGASHSAILVLMNLYNLASTSHPDLKVKWFTRSPLLYAEYKKDYILYDNTGLKGQAADFARENLEDSKLPRSPVGKIIEKVDCSAQEQAQYSKYLPECTHIIQATGFATNPMPALSRDGSPLGQVQYDHRQECFVDQNNERIRGLYGAGIAFPERVTDPEGNVEYSVGLWKFMKYLKRVSGDWVRVDVPQLSRTEEPRSMM